MHGETLQYPEHFLDRLEAVWGEGFLSPGGAGEVREILRGLDPSGWRILDVGCGTGGPACVLAGELGAAGVLGIDVEPQILARAERRVAAAGLEGRITLRLVTPGPLPFADSAFDCVFSKDSLIHIADKEGLFREILRVLKPGGVFAASDWLAGENAAADPAMRRFLAIEPLDFRMATAAETEAALRRSGFVRVTSRDRGGWYAREVRRETARIEGPLRERVIEMVGEEIYHHWVAVRRALADAVRSGALRPTHLRGFKPADGRG